MSISIIKLMNANFKFCKLKYTWTKNDSFSWTYGAEINYIEFNTKIYDPYKGNIKLIIVNLRVKFIL